MTSAFTRITKQKNRRRAERYMLQMPLKYRTVDNSAGTGWKRGHTVEMSSTGILLIPTEPIGVSTELELAIDWPGLYHGREVMCLLAAGVVIRVDARGAAFRMVKYEFRDVSRNGMPSGRPEKSRAVA